MEVKVSTEGYEILSSGSVIVPSNEYIQFNIEEFKFRFLFMQESQDDDAPIRISKNLEQDENGDSYLSVIISNVRNSFFGSTDNSFQLATMNNRALSVRFSILSINRDRENRTEDKILFYTWYLANN